MSVLALNGLGLGFRGLRLGAWGFRALRGSGFRGSGSTDIN